MPIYEYEPVGRDCLMCPNRIEVMQGVNDPPYTYCPYCGMEVKRITSRAQFKIKAPSDPDGAAQRGFSTFKKTDEGVWEKVAGTGPEKIVRDTSSQDPADPQRAKKGELRLKKTD